MAHQKWREENERFKKSSKLTMSALSQHLGFLKSLVAQLAAFTPLTLMLAPKVSSTVSIMVIP